MLTRSRLAGFGNDHKLMNCVTRHLRDYFELTVYAEEESVYQTTPMAALIDGHGILDADIFTQVFDDILSVVQHNPMWLLNDPYVGGRTHFMTAAMFLCGEEPELDDAFMNWLCERVLCAIDDAPEYVITYERKTLMGWKLGRRRCDAQFISDRLGPMLARQGDAENVANIRVQDRTGEDVTFSFACFCG